MVDTAGVILFPGQLPRVVLGFWSGVVSPRLASRCRPCSCNPLADPCPGSVQRGRIGVAVAVLFGIGTTVLALSLLPVCGFVGGLVALAVMYRMAVTHDRLPTHSVLLTGVIRRHLLRSSCSSPHHGTDRSFGMMAG